MTTPSPSRDSWLLVEDQGLRDHLKTVKVTDNGTARPVGVWFGMPDPEIRSQSYPFFTIDLVDISEQTAHVQSHYGGPVKPHLAARLPTGDQFISPTGTHFLSPMMLTYQVTAWARLPRHDRQILSQANHSQLHPRFAQLLCPDNSVRRLIVQGFAKRDSIQEDKRLFRNIWTLQVPTEIVYDEVALTRRVEQVMINPDAIIRSPGFEILRPIYYPGDD